MPAAGRLNTHHVIGWLGSTRKMTERGRGMRGRRFCPVAHTGPHPNSMAWPMSSPRACKPAVACAWCDLLLRILQSPCWAAWGSTSPSQVLQPGPVPLSGAIAASIANNTITRPRSSSSSNSSIHCVYTL